MDTVFIFVLSVSFVLTNVLCQSPAYNDNPCPTGFWGTNCQHICSNNCQNNDCDKVSGSCVFGCEKGYFGDKCESGCLNCRNGNCNRDSGTCSDGCSTGYYTPECSLRCNSECRHEVCHRKTGDCTFKCNDGFYGQKCDFTCPTNCCACDPINGTCLIDHCYTHICYTMTVTFAVAGTVVLILVTATLIYRYTKRKLRQGENIQQGDAFSRPPADVPRASLSQGTLNHYDVITDEYCSGRSIVSRSLDSLEVKSVRTQFKPPGKCKPTLPRKKFRNTFLKRRAKSLSDSLESMPSCWVGTGQEVLELFSTNSKEQDDSMGESQTDGEPEGSLPAQIKASTLGKGEPLSVLTETEAEFQNDVPSSKSETSRTKKGYISAIFDTLEVDPLVPRVESHETIPE